jgi:hypothetical protein
MSGGSETGSSHDDPDVLYIAFTGTDAVPGATGADWTADNFDDFHKSIVSLGDKLVKRIGGNNTGDGDDNTCTWAGHCLGKSFLSFPFPSFFPTPAASAPCLLVGILED